MVRTIEDCWKEVISCSVDLFTVFISVLVFVIKCNETIMCKTQ